MVGPVLGSLCARLAALRFKIKTSLNADGLGSSGGRAAPCQNPRLGQLFGMVVG